MYKFMLPEGDAFKREGEETVAGYVFTDGAMMVQDDTAAMIAPKLCRFYGVTYEKMQEVEAEEPDGDDASLSASNTKQ